MTTDDLDPEYLARMGEPPSSIAHLLQLQADGDSMPCGATRPGAEREEVACPEPRL